MSPAYPAAWLLFGLIFAMAGSHFLSLSWTRPATVAVYSVPLLWCLLISRDRTDAQMKANVIDAGFVVFVVTVLASAFVMSGLDENGAVSKYIRFLPFMMITPYVLGRLMRLPDLDLFSRITLFAGLALLPLLLLDRLMLVQRPGRLPIFGLDHGPLLVGGLLAVLLLILCTRVLTDANTGEKVGRLRQLFWLGLIGCVTAMLVWVMARGWLLAGLVSVALVCLWMRTRTLAVRAGLFAYVLAITALTLYILPAPAFYAAILTAPAPAPAPATATASCPILGEASCQPFRDGIDSVAMRWVLYREAVAMFMANPIWGVGAARFGDCSCTGPGWYPHSTFLQGFAELGLIGGGLLLGLFLSATITFVRGALMRSSTDGCRSLHALAFALLVMFIIADQFSGTYFMAAGFWLMVGVAASLRAQDRQETSGG